MGVVGMSSGCTLAYTEAASARQGLRKGAVLPFSNRAGLPYSGLGQVDTEVAGRMAVREGTLRPAMGDRYRPPADSSPGAAKRKFVMKSSLIRRFVPGKRRKHRRVAPPEGYDRWAVTYDSQPDNAVLALESRLFSELLVRIVIEGKGVLDIGCGTGRHWPEILSWRPARLTGVDPSSGMLQRLKVRYPNAETFCSAGDRLAEMAAGSFDVIVSTLALAHIPDASIAIREWHRILKATGSMLITDFHPDAIRSGMKRTFIAQGETIEIEHHVTEINQLQNIARKCGLTVSFISERSIDDSVRPLFERDLALREYDKYKGLRLVFGMVFTKT